ncbi:MAG: peptidoglycan DD-metalloendopeptidase family protein [Clostridia bacterium]|nr:peptidoglycan DD-metalloendopeptidase family protein [Clostridia bacterium]
MTKRKFKIMIACIFLFAALTAGASAAANGVDLELSAPNAAPGAVQPEQLSAEDLEIVRDQAILRGKSKQMKLKAEQNGIFNIVTWSSSNEDVISCTKTGLITGKRQGVATIKVKAIFGDAEQSIRVYCAERLQNTYMTGPKAVFLLVDYTPSLFNIKTPYFDFFSIMRGRASKRFTVEGYYGSYYYVSYLNSAQTREDGFIAGLFLPSDLASGEQFKSLSRAAIDIWENVDSDKYVVTTAYTGAVEWRSSDTSIFTYDPQTHRLYGLKPGVAKLTATAQNKTLSCNVRVMYKWPQKWIGAARASSYFYVNSGNGLIQYAALPQNASVTVFGDMGNRDGWAYCSYLEDGRTEPYWGFVQIGDVSTKNTVSFYNSLGWGYPLQDTSYNYIKSPYAPRVLNGRQMDHRGFDISTSEVKTQASIFEKVIVAPFDGVVKKVGSDQDQVNGGGYYVCLTSNTVDPVTQKRIIVIVQHMKSEASVKEGREINKGVKIGCVGRSGNADGPHLHLEANNWNAAYGEAGSRGFNYTINPIYFYLTFPFDKNDGCYAVINGYGHYWYNNDN